MFQASSLVAMFQAPLCAMFQAYTHVAMFQAPQRTLYATFQAFHLYAMFQAFHLVAMFQAYCHIHEHSFRKIVACSHASSA